MVLDNLTTIGKIGLALFVVGAAFFVLGFAVPYWAYSGLSNFGLWQQCGRSSRSYCISTVDLKTDYSLFDTDWFRGTQALACLALIALIINFIVLILFICGKPRKFLLISVVLNCATATLAFLAAVVFGSELGRSYAYHLNWGFAFDIIGGIFIAGAAACFLVEFCRRR